MERISHFDLESPIPCDLPGELYAARDLAAGRSVRLLVVSRSLLPSKPAEQLFIQDLLDASKIDHPAVARVYGVEEADGRILVSYEAVAQEPPARDAGPLAPSEAVGIFRRILEGLDAAHGAGVVHGWLSRRDVAVGADRSVKLLSFGLDRLLRHAAATGVDPARAAFVSPEVLRGMDAEPSSDLRSAGAILVGLLTGRPPFEADDVPSIVYRILNADPLAGPARDRVPADLRPLLGRLLRKDSAHRPSSARDALAILNERSRGAEAKGARISLGVMYMEHSPAGDGRAHIAVGVTEDLIFRLARIGRLAVTSRHDALVLKGRDADPQQLGRCMGLDYVVTGVVAAAGDGVRVEARAVDTATGASVWAGSIERPSGGAFAIAPALAAELLTGIGIDTGGNEDEIIARPITADERAFDFHARGRDFLTRRGRQNTQAAIRAFEYALACDPALAVAEEGLAAAYSAMFTYYDGGESWLESMARAAGRALEMDPGLIEARLHLAIVSLHRKDYEGAKAGLEQVLVVRPGYYEAYRWLGVLCDMTGRYDEAIGYYGEAAESKPCSVEPWLFMNMTHRRRGDHTAAMDAARRFLEVGLRFLRVAPDDPVTLSRFCPIYTLFGETEKARDTLDRILRTGTEDGLVLYNCAATYALLGDPEDCLSCLRKALSAGYQNVREWIEGDPDFAGVRESAPFRALLSEFDLRHGDHRHDP